MTCRRQAGMRLVAMMAATVAVAAFAQVAAAAPIRTALSGKCLEAAPNPTTGSYNASGFVYAENCRTIATSPQNWLLTHAGTAPIAGRRGTFNVYVIHNGAAGLCLNNSGSLLNGGRMIVSTCSTRSSHLWTIGRSGVNGSQELVNAASGKCLDVFGGFLGSGVRMIQYDCSPTPFDGQLFFF